MGLNAVLTEEAFSHMAPNTGLLQTPTYTHIHTHLAGVDAHARRSSEAPAGVCGQG